MDALKRAIDSDWPEIQKQLIAEGGADDTVTPISVDSWWLDNFERKDVIIELPGIVIMNSRPFHARYAAETMRRAYGVFADADCGDCFKTEDFLAHIERFPEGQFASMRISGPGAGCANGFAVTMRAARPPSAPILPWLEAIGDLQLSAHQPDGAWLYGVEMAVHPLYRRKGIASSLYKARFRLVKELNLRGWYAVGMLMGYQDYADKMSVIEYGKRVIAGEIKDPTVSLQLKRGFRAQGVVTDYCDEPAAGDAGVLIVWDNPDYEER